MEMYQNLESFGKAQPATLIKVQRVLLNKPKDPEMKLAVTSLQRKCFFNQVS